MVIIFPSPSGARKRAGLPNGAVAPRGLSCATWRLESSSIPSTSKGSSPARGKICFSFFFPALCPVREISKYKTLWKHTSNHIWKTLVAHYCPLDSSKNTNLQIISNPCWLHPPATSWGVLGAVSAMLRGFDSGVANFSNKSAASSGAPRVASGGDMAQLTATMLESLVFLMVLPVAPDMPLLLINAAKTYLISCCSSLCFSDVVLTFSRFHVWQVCQPLHHYAALSDGCIQRYNSWILSIQCLLRFMAKHSTFRFQQLVCGNFLSSNWSLFWNL